ncbi:hypothetical protein [Legionella yabuuchiae]|uniref:hypothetical protein n=1 Tax=Legionella yabuuchiae TaxID=376727 RepID=UPI0010549390|nr:hypothetical protein [Legionella yabuuchiae]
MKKITCFTLSLITSVSFAANTGLLFDVTANKPNLTIKPNVNFFYSSAGIQITSPGFTLQNPGHQNCTPTSSGFCLFAVSPSQPKTLTITGDGQLTYRLCTNGDAPLNCQNYTADFSDGASCTAAGGQTVSGSNACWVQETIINSTTILRCSDVCTRAGLTLQQPGPENNETLASNVCSAFGNTGPVIEESPGDITFIGTVSVAPGTCFWENLTGTNWNNPNNSDYNGVTGSYFCPCNN